MKRQSRAMKIIKSKTAHTIGGYENEIEDGHRDHLPEKAELVEEIYNDIVNAPGWESIQNKDLRFATTKLLKQMIDGNVEVYFRKGRQ